MTMFNKLYGHYKDTWGLEMRLTRNNMTYREAYQKSLKDEEWF